MSASSADAPETAKGVVYGLAAYTIWGCFPLFFSLFDGVPSWEILTHRVIWCCVFLVLLITILGKWSAIRSAFSDPSQFWRVFACALLIGTNWGIFIYAVESHQVFQASLGYFLTPLINVALGILFLQEKMAVLQRWSVGLAGLAILLQFVFLGQVPWISLLLAVTFGIYGLLRKQMSLDGLSGLFVETLLLLPFGLVALMWLVGTGHSHFLNDAWHSFLLVATGVVTALPLLAFAGAARRLRLATVGFLMYINPTMQFLTALLIFKEPLTAVQTLSFVMIWTALAMYSFSAWRSHSGGRTA